jgi:hypothetical protein
VISLGVGIHFEIVLGSIGSRVLVLILTTAIVLETSEYFEEIITNIKGCR